jgi:hypothetical protein
MKFYETYEFTGIGYAKLFHYQSWRVAILNYIEELEVNHINYVECHSKTDEAFVLLNGSCKLLFADVKDNQIIGFHSLNLEQHKIYKIPCGVYHTHTLSLDAKVLVIEEENTNYENSPRIYLTPDQKTILNQLHLGEKNEVSINMARSI